MNKDLPISRIGLETKKDQQIKTKPKIILRENSVDAVKIMNYSKNILNFQLQSSAAKNKKMS